MYNIPDVLGMKMPAAAKLLDAAGVSYSTEILKPIKSQPENGDMRIIRQINTGESSVKLSLCSIFEGQPESGKAPGTESGSGNSGSDSSSDSGDSDDSSDSE